MTNHLSTALAPKRASNKGVFKKVAASIAVASIALTGVVALTAPASAAEAGVGVGEWPSTFMAYKGTFQQDGVRMVCGDPGATYPTDRLVNSGTVSNWKGVTGNQLAGINRVLHQYVNTGDPLLAAGLQYAVAHVVEPSHDGIAFDGSNHGDLNSVINYDLYSQVGGSGGVSTVQNHTWNIVNEINSTTAGSGSTGSGSLVFTVDGGNNYNGTVEMDGTAGSTGTITLSNGVFVANGTNTIAATEGVVYQVRGQAPDDASPYKISGTGSFTAPGTSGYAANVTVWKSNSGQQDSLSPGSMAVNSPFNVAGEDPSVRGVQFLPVLGTTAESFIQEGENFTDVLQFSTVADDNGTNNDWFQSRSGNFAPVTATGTVYGPFQSQPEESAEVPEDAPVAGTAEITTDLAEGPSAQYTATSDASASDAGYYTWVWEIDWANQDAGTQRVVPGPSTGNEDQEPYYFQDTFGQVIETSIVPSDLSITTQVLKPEVALDEVSIDSLTIDSNGYWLQTPDAETGELTNIPVVLRGELFYVAREDAPEGVEQVPSTEIPEFAQSLGSMTYDVNETGNYTPEEGIAAPSLADGYLTWVWSINTEDQPAEFQGMVREFSDDFGVPSETQEIALPEVATQSQAGAKLGETIKDTAIVEGTLPFYGAELTFEAYEVPMIEDPANPGKFIIDYPTDPETGEVLTGLDWVCNEDNVLYDGTAEGQVITENGNYDSAEVIADKYAKVLWVETLWTVPQGDEERQVIHRGECGIPNETTHIVDVTTKAVTDGSNIDAVENGVAIDDTVQLVGYVPEGGSVEVEVYLTDPNAAPVCEAPVATLPVATDLEGGLYTADNPLELVTTEPYIYDGNPAQTLFFVEVTTDELDREVSRGECGDPNETAGLKGAKVIATGGDLLPYGIGAAGLLLLGGLIAGAVAIRRNKAKADA